jgi:hypothetical protein
MTEQVNFHWNNDEVRILLDQHVQLDFYSASSLKQLFWFRANQSLPLSAYAACLAEKQQIPVL